MLNCLTNRNSAATSIGRDLSATVMNDNNRRQTN